MATTTKTKPKAATKPAQVPATRRSTAVLTGTASSLLKKHAGAGISHAQEDNIVPLIYLLQANSPQCIRGNEKQVRGAAAGDIWLRNAPPDTCIVKGDDGMQFLACHFNKCWLEWLPERGGFAGRHDKRPDDATQVEVTTDGGDKKKIWQMPNGNSVAESREFAGFFINDDGEMFPYTLPMGGTNHTVAKQWMSTMRDSRLGDGDPAPLFASVWRIKTKLRTNGPNSWFVYTVDHEYGLEDAEDQEAATEMVKKAIALRNAFETGEKKSDTVDAGVDAAEGAASGDEDI